MFFGDHAHRVMRRRALPGQSRAVPGETVERCEPRRVGLVRLEEGEGVKARRLVPLSGDDAQRALPREVVEAGGETAGADIDAARHHGDRDRLRRVEKHELGIDPSIFEISALDREIERPRARRPDRADLDVLGARRGDERERREAEARSVSCRAPRSSN